MVNNLVIIEDDPIISDALEEMAKTDLKLPWETYPTAGEFLSSHRVGQNSIYLIDWNLPGDVQGPDLVKVIRLQDNLSPIFMISGNANQEFIVEGLKSGADDYLTKPFDKDELLTRIQNATLKSKALQENLINIGIKIIPGADLIIKDGEKLSLTKREFQVFNELYSNPDVVHSRQSIIAIFDDHETTERNVDVLVFGLRKKIAKIGLHIVTIRGSGYKMAKLA